MILVSTVKKTIIWTSSSFGFVETITIICVAFIVTSVFVIGSCWRSVTFFRTQHLIGVYIKTIILITVLLADFRSNILGLFSVFDLSFIGFVIKLFRLQFSLIFLFELINKLFLVD